MTKSEENALIAKFEGLPPSRIPDYETDLEAITRAANRLGGFNQIKFGRFLWKIICPSYESININDNPFRLAQATAVQKREALLKIVNNDELRKKAKGETPSRSIIGARARLIEGRCVKDRRWTRVRYTTKCGTGVHLEETRDGYYWWNIRDLEIEPQEIQRENDIQD